MASGCMTLWVVRCGVVWCGVLRAVCAGWSESGLLLKKVKGGHARNTLKAAGRSHLMMQQPTTRPVEASSATRHANCLHRRHRCCARLCVLRCCWSRGMRLSSCGLAGERTGIKPHTTKANGLLQPLRKLTGIGATLSERRRAAPAACVSARAAERRGAPGGAPWLQAWPVKGLAVLQWGGRG